jgi:hypothetical protein
MRSRAVLFCLVAALAPACTTPCKNAETRSELHDFDVDNERCEAEARKRLGNVDIGDYRACMRVRGWCESPY